MSVIVLTILLGISVLGWLKNWLGLRVLVYYMETQKYAAVR